MRVACSGETHGFTRETETQELSPKKMGSKAEICRRRRGRSVFTTQDLGDFRASAHLFGNREQWKLKKLIRESEC